MSEEYSALNSVWNSAAGKYGRIPGTEDWVTVAELGDGGYEWTEFKAFYSPSQRIYFWHGGSGCSCNSWSDDVANSMDFSNGDKIALLRAWGEFCKQHTYDFSVEQFLDGASKIRSFNGDA